MKSYEPFLCLPLAAGARWLPTRPDSARAHERPQGKGRRGGFGPVLCGEEEEKNGVVVLHGGTVMMWDGGCPYYPQVELVSPWSAFRWPWRQAGPLAVQGVRNARKAKGKGRLVGHRAGLE